MSNMKIESSQIEVLKKSIKEYGTEAEHIINQYLHGDGYQQIERAIKNAMPESGRKWKKKDVGAKYADSLTDMFKNSNLEVTIGAAKKYSYLYWPDDGGNSKSHAGNQQFFKSGAESVKENIINDLLSELTR